MARALDAWINRRRSRRGLPHAARADDWVSGETVWLLDVVAHDRQQAGDVGAGEFPSTREGKTVKIMPLMARLIDPEVVGKLRGRRWLGT